jgi:triosephosphate isomerase
MKKIFLIANWKSNKTTEEAKGWLEQFQAASFKPEELVDKEIIICPPFLLLPYLHTAQTQQNKLVFKLGVQDLSPYDAGAFTGEEPPKLVKEYADFAIIGHSERRTHFHETDDLLLQKVKMSQKYNLVPIYCIQNKDTPVPLGVTLVAYEPPTAIGTGNPDTPENAQRVAQTVRYKYPYVTSVFYGGSVTPDNIQSFVKMEHINGVLVGGASLDPVKFATLIKNASV